MTFVATLRQRDWQVVEAESANPLEQAVPYALLKKLVQARCRQRISPPRITAGSSEDSHAGSRRALACGTQFCSRSTGRRSTLARSRTLAGDGALIIDAVRDMLDRVVLRRGRRCCCWRICIGSMARARRSCEALMSLATSRPLLVPLTWRTEYTPDWPKAWMYCGSGFGRSTRPRQTCCSTICSARLPISMRSRPVSSATPDQIPLFIEEVARQLIRSPRRWRRRGILGHPRKFLPPFRSDRVAHRIACRKKTRRFCSSLRSSDRAYRHICSPP